MEIERRTYDPRLHDKKGAYIHRYFLPQECRQRIQPQDLAALHWHVIEAVCGGKSIKNVRAGMLAGPCTIHYRTEGLVKEIPAELLEPAIDACLRYGRDRQDWSLTEEQTNFLMALNERLRRLEMDIKAECFRLNREMQERRKKRAPFSDDYEIMAIVSYKLCDDHPLSRDDDDNFVHQESFRKTAPEGEQEECEGDWNDARGATNPVIRNSPLFGVPHCWLFHNLQSHSPAPLKHLCGIGTFWVEIQVWHQQFINRTKWFASKDDR